MQEDFEWYAEQRKKMYDNLQDSINAEFERTHDIIMKDFVPKETIKDKGTIRNINNYRMKLWCDMFIEYKKNSLERSFAASCATKDLEMFDIQFNQ